MDAIAVASTAAGAEVIRAAGGVVWRERRGELEVVVVHRPKYDDWSLPKGKRDHGETDEACALREVEEETGLRCTLGQELAPSDYQDRKARPKQVRWWAMQVVDGRPRPSEECDEVRWVALGEAAPLLSYERDRVVLDEFTSLFPCAQAFSPHC